MCRLRVQYLILGIVLSLITICPCIGDITVNGVEYQWANWNNAGVQNGPPSGTPYFTIDNTVMVTYLDSYHYNDGYGVSYPGTLSLISNDGQEYGPYQMISSETNNIIWNYVPYEGEIILPPGTYTVVDSDPVTWSNNAESGYAGFFGIKWEAYETDGAITPIVPVQEPPVSEPHSSDTPVILDYTMTSGVDANSQPLDRKHDFFTSDEKAQFWVNLGPLYGGEKREIVFYSPDGQEFYRGSSQIKDPAEKGYDYWKNYQTSSYIYIKGKDAEHLPGTWHVDFYLDGNLMAYDDFRIQSSFTPNIETVPPAPAIPETIVKEPPKVLDYTITSGVDDNLQPIDRKDTFSIQDQKVQFWVSVGPLYGGENRQIVFYSPDGKEYYRTSVDVKDPEESGYSSWKDYSMSSYIDIQGAEAELHPGAWRVELYIDGTFMIADEFTLNSGGSINIGDIISAILPVGPKPDVKDPGAQNPAIIPDVKEEVDVTVLTDYAFILNANSKYEKANEVCDLALEYNSGSASAYSLKGWAFMGMDKNSEALEYLNKALSYQTDPLTLSNKMYCLINLGKCDEARKIGDQLVSMVDTSESKEIYQKILDQCKN